MAMARPRFSIVAARGALALWGVLALGGTCTAQPAASTAAGGAAGGSDAAEKRSEKKPGKAKVGPLEVTLDWRVRVESWSWFKGETGNSTYAFGHSLLRVGLGQTLDRVDWLVEASQPSIAGLPDDAAVSAPLGQLGLGGTYYVANEEHRSRFGGFLKQAYVDLKRLGPTSLKLGRFEFFDGLEVKPKEPTLAAVVSGRIAHRLISNFGFTAAQRTFDGLRFAWSAGSDNVTLFAARPTEGIFQVEGMDELRIEILYGAYTRSIEGAHGAGQLRLFALGYRDDRTSVLKTDNRPQAAREADGDRVEIQGYGASYAHVFDAGKAGKFDVVAWGSLQAGSWGVLSHRAHAFVAEVGWLPAVERLKPWVSAGYSQGSGDSDPGDDRHGTFFQVLTTPRQYARLPFYNMMNNADAYVTLNLKPTSKLSLRSEVHALHLHRDSDLWYLGGGAFQAKTFGYVGRPSGGKRSLGSVWDLSAAYQFTPRFGMNGYYGHASGGDVVEGIYTRDADASFAYIETTFRL